MSLLSFAYKSVLNGQAEAARKASLQHLGSPSSLVEIPEPGSSTAIAIAETFNISNEECIRRLRSKGQPIRLFGEEDKERRLRLRALELMEKTSGSSSQGFNDFHKLVKDMEMNQEAREEEKRAKMFHKLAQERESGSSTSVDDSKREREEQRRKVADQVLDLKLIKDDPPKLYPIIYYALKVGLVVLARREKGAGRLIYQGVLKEWEEWMEARPGESCLRCGDIRVLKLIP
jgi:pre-mRNA-splicing factor 18